MLHFYITYLNRPSLHLVDIVQFLGTVFLLGDVVQPDSCRQEWRACAPSCTEGVAVLCWRSCWGSLQCGARGGSWCQWWMSTWPTSSLACPAFSCPRLWLCSPPLDNDIEYCRGHCSIMKGLEKSPAEPKEPQSLLFSFGLVHVEQKVVLLAPNHEIQDNSTVLLLCAPAEHGCHWSAIRFLLATVNTVSGILRQTWNAELQSKVKP